MRESTLSVSALSFFPLRATCFKAFNAPFTESITEVDEGDEVRGGSSMIMEAVKEAI